jgi:TonB family protein
MAYSLFKIKTLAIILMLVAAGCGSESQQNLQKQAAAEKSDFADADVFNTDGQAGEPIFQAVKKRPEFVGGKKAMYAFINGRVKHPTEAARKGVSGLVYVRFVVEKDGSVTQPKLLKGIGSGCDEEAVRVISMMPNWTPGEHEGKKVRVFHSLPVAFRKVKLAE